MPVAGELLIMDQYAVIGHPIKHSLSPIIHAEFAKQTEQEMTYTAIEAPLDDFAGVVKTFFQQGGRGLNVTLPFKQQAFALADQSSESAKQAQAANTLMLRDNQTIFADSTDGVGLIQDLVNNHHYSLLQKKILLVGAGGAACSVVGPLLKAAPRELVIANRTLHKAQQLAEHYQMCGDVQAVALDAIDQQAFDLIINATSAAVLRQSLLLPETIVGPNSVCYDMFYTRGVTPFLAWAKEHGVGDCFDGLGMLVEQAAAAFYLWRGVHPETSMVIEKLRGVC